MDKKTDTYKSLATEQHKLIMKMMKHGLFEIDPDLSKLSKAYAKKCLTSKLILKIMANG